MSEITVASTALVGDCREVLAGYAPETFHAIITDPPYELNFMGRGWDNAGVSFDPETWRAVYRVLKPGGHLLAFGGSRTFHRIAVAIEDAGFEIRDTLSWLYGSGFPKSLDVGKAIDKQRKDDPRPVCQFLRAAISEHPTETVKMLAARFGFHSRMVEHWAARDTDSQPSVPTWDQWIALKDILRFGDEMDAEVWRLNGRKGQPGDNWDKREVVGTSNNGIAGGTGKHVGQDDAWGFRGEFNITAPATDAAREWDGWGTALKPAWEPIIMARKPFRSTVAANVMAHGTGALNIDGCRVEYAPDGDVVHPSRHNVTIGGNGIYGGGVAAVTGGHAAGRWPPNVAMDEDAAAMLDEMSGVSKSNVRPPTGKDDRGVPGFVMRRADTKERGHNDTGGASRFMYVAKASRAERNAGLDGMPEQMWPEEHTAHESRRCRVCGNWFPKPMRDNRYPGSTCKCESPEYDKVGRTPSANHHPTVKPVALMRWLVRMVTPPGGHILDPFMGSGSTGIAAVLEGFAFTGIDLSSEYAEIARRRIAHAGAQPALFREEVTA